MRLLWLLENIVRGNPDFEPAASGAIYVAVLTRFWYIMFRGNDHG